MTKVAGRFVVAVLLITAFAGCISSDPSEVTDGPPAPVVTEPTVNETIQAPVEQKSEPYPWYPSDGFSERTDILIESIGGHMVPATVYKPAVASADQQVPVLVHSHGFTGSRMSANNEAIAYIEAGFGVVSFDQRGHGDATDTSEVNFMQPDIEVQDAIAVIDEIATWDWVLMERDDPTDPVLGTIGYSYAGAMQLMTSVFDSRIDAMVPEMTWNNITTALAPNGVIKSGWVDLFYVAGNSISPITFSDDFLPGFAWATATNELPAGQAPGVPDLVSLFNKASLDSYPDGLTVPTRLIQSPIDTLFPLNQAVWNYNQLRANGVEAQLYTYLGGHVLHTDSLYGESPIGYGAGLQGAPGGWPCGEREELGINWHQRWLLELDVDIGPNTCLSLEDETAIVGDAFPLPGTDFQQIEVGGPWPIVQGGGAGSAVPMATLTFDEDTVIAGIPRLAGSITAPGPDTIVYFSFYKEDTDGLLEHIVDDQVRPLRVKGPNTAPVAFDMEMGGIATKLPAGDSLYLMLTSVEPVFFGNSGRVPSGTVVDNVVLTLPVIPDPQYR